MSMTPKIPDALLPELRELHDQGKTFQDLRIYLNDTYDLIVSESVICRRLKKPVSSVTERNKLTIIQESAKQTVDNMRIVKSKINQMSEAFDAHMLKGDTHKAKEMADALHKFIKLQADLSGVGNDPIDEDSVEFEQTVDKMFDAMKKIEIKGDN